MECLLFLEFHVLLELACFTLVSSRRTKLGSFQAALCLSHMHINRGQRPPDRVWEEENRQGCSVPKSHICLAQLKVLSHIKSPSKNPGHVVLFLLVLIHL